MTDTEKKIAEMLDLSKPVSDCPECGGLGEIRSLGSRRKCECLYIRLKTLKRELDRRDEENRKLREERDAAVEGYQQQVKYAGELMTKLVSAQQERNMYKSSSEVFYERLKKVDEERQRLIDGLLTIKNIASEDGVHWKLDRCYTTARDILHEIGVTVE